LPGLGAIAILLFELLYILVKYRKRLLALCVRGDGGDAGGADAAAAAAAAGEDDGGDGGDEDGGKGKGEGGGDEEEDPVADYLDHNYTKGLDDSETVAVSPVMLYKVNRAKKRAREAARQAALEGGGDGDGGGGGGGGGAGAGRPGGLARLGFKLTKGKAGAEKENNAGAELKVIEMYLAREEEIDTKHKEAAKATAAGEHGASLLEVAMATEHRSNIGRVGGRRGSLMGESAAMGRERLKNLSTSKPELFKPNPAAERTSAAARGADEEYRKSVIARASQR